MTDDEVKKFRNLEPGKTFEFRDKNLIVSKSTGNCEGCFFKNRRDCVILRMVASVPECNGNYREDGKYIIFKEVE